MIHSFPQVVPKWLKTGTQRDQKDTIDNRLKTHNPKVVGSNPASATTKNGLPMQVKPFFLFV
jgi:hypothetical protein